jgi:hypothetical protein
MKMMEAVALFALGGNKAEIEENRSKAKKDMAAAEDDKAAAIKKALKLGSKKMSNKEVFGQFKTRCASDPAQKAKLEPAIERELKVLEEKRMAAVAAANKKAKR